MPIYAYHTCYYIPGKDNKSVRQWPTTITVFKEERANTAHPGEPFGVWGRFNTMVYIWFFTELSSMNKVTKELAVHGIRIGGKDGNEDAGPLNICFLEDVKGEQALNLLRMACYAFERSN